MFTVSGCAKIFNFFYKIKIIIRSLTKTKQLTFEYLHFQITLCFTLKSFADCISHITSPVVNFVEELIRSIDAYLLRYKVSQKQKQVQLSMFSLTQTGRGQDMFIISPRLNFRVVQSRKLKFLGTRDFIDRHLC